MFNPNLKIGQVISNATLMATFKCSQQGGMRKSNTTNTLVLVSDYTRGIYHDKWIGGILHYTGMGLSGDQDINYMQNRTLNESKHNGVDVHLFEVMTSGEYTYCGRVELVSKPYTEVQKDQNEVDRIVWMFPVRPIPDNDVVKPALYVFRDMDEYNARGKNVDQEYAALLAERNDSKKSTCKKSVGIKGRQVKHVIYGIGNVVKLEDNTLHVVFAGNNKKLLNYSMCLEKGLIEFI